jgi:hypothetical protein
MDAIPAMDSYDGCENWCYLIAMRAATIWLCLALLWFIDATVSPSDRHDVRQALVAGLVAACFLAAGIYLPRSASRRRPLNLAFQACIVPV